MNIEFSGKDSHPSDELKDRIQRKMEKLEARLHQKLFTRVKFGTEGDTFTCTIHFNARHDYNAAGSGTDMYKAADDALSKIERQVERTHRRPGHSGE